MSKNWKDRDGWRILSVGEMIANGDEWISKEGPPDKWEKSPLTGFLVEDDDCCWYARKATSMIPLASPPSVA